MQWMATSLQPLLREVCSRRALAERGLLDADLAVKLALGKSTQRLPSSLQGWSLMILELWCRAVIDIPGPQGKHAMGTRVGRYEPSSSGLSPAGSWIGVQRMFV